MITADISSGKDRLHEAVNEGRDFYSALHEVRQSRLKYGQSPLLLPEGAIDTDDYNLTQEAIQSITKVNATNWRYTLLSHQDASVEELQQKLPQSVLTGPDDRRRDAFGFSPTEVLYLGENATVELECEYYTGTFSVVAKIPLHRLELNYDIKEESEIIPVLEEQAQLKYNFDAESLVIYSDEDRNKLTEDLYIPSLETTGEVKTPPDLEEFEFASLTSPNEQVEAIAEFQPYFTTDTLKKLFALSERIVSGVNIELDTEGQVDLLEEFATETGYVFRTLSSKDGAYVLSEKEAYEEATYVSELYGTSKEDIDRFERSNFEGCLLDWNSEKSDLSEDISEGLSVEKARIAQTVFEMTNIEEEFVKEYKYGKMYPFSSSVESIKNAVTKYNKFGRLKDRIYREYGIDIGDEFPAPKGHAFTELNS